ncbi:hypothetical protein GQ53DRAFT_871375 [Thozetella sp. PMI_491]|nr:hypothetical protein GQ53DRAFT_871375 [Thozetella sp. PMI_491]
MDVSKVTAAALAQSNEVQLALASLNFDFALFKIEAPQEYKALDALIGSIIASPDNLVKAYGLRVSDICSSPAANPRGSRADGLFRNYVGADSTTIWAAATSGRGALAVHLLACMLARLWTPAEATSIWAEIVEERKAQISAEYDPAEPSHYPLIRASQLEITRAELASWDSGARAWLAVADKAKQRQHSQLRLIIENLSISVNNNSAVFPSVIKAWRSGMEMVSNLLSGVSQRVNDGAVLLALSSWHIYPDMDVFCESNKTVAQRDPLMCGAGRLIVGLEDADPLNSTGVFWSLSLSHLRYYGDPILCQRSAAEDASRVTFKEFTLVALGCFLQKWCTWRQDGLGTEQVVDMIIAMGEFIDEVANFWNLVKMGTRRGSAFLGPLEGHPPRFFGLTSPSVVLGRLKNDTATLIDAIRAMTSSSPQVSGKTIFVGYTHKCPLGKWREFATVVPISTPSGPKHVRWIPVEFADMRDPAWMHNRNQKTRTDDILAMGELCEKYYPESLLISRTGLSCHVDPADCLFSATANVPLSLALTEQMCAEREKARRGREPEPLQEFSFNRIDDDLPVAIYADGVCMAELELSEKNIAYFLKSRYFDIQKLEELLSTVWFEKASASYVRSMRALSTADQIYKLMPSATVSLSVLRKELGKQKWVPVEDEEHPYEEDKDDEFVVVKEKRSAFEGFEVGRPESFSCVAFFETGTMDLSPGCFADVMAISSGNSIFASSSILCDPWEKANPFEIQRLVANIGRPGLSMLIPPMNPKMRKIDFNSWRYESPVPGAVLHGAQDVEANYVETLAQVFDGAKWVGDIDILGALASHLVKRIPLPHGCQNHAVPSKPRFPAVSIDNWDELIDAPSAPGVIRAHENFVGRLAAAAISVQKGHLTFILPKQVCWTCIESSMLSSIGDVSGGVFIR